MNSIENQEMTAIDKFYGEESKKNITSKNQSIAFDNEFNIKLEDTLSKMDKLESLDYDLDINILSIINKAETIQNKRKNTIELLGFILVSLVLLSTVFIIVFNFGTRFILYSQIIISTFMPLLLIPFSLTYRVKEGK